MANSLPRAGFLRRLALNTSGNIALLFAFSMPLVVGAGGFGVETTYLYYKRSQLQAAADAAAHAGATELRSSGRATEVEPVARTVAVDNGFTAPEGQVEVNAPPSSGAYRTRDAVEVILTERQQRFFTAFFSSEPIFFRARAVAEFRTAANACVLALNRTSGRSAQFAGNSVARFNGCVVMSNSTATDAVNVQGSASLRANCVISAGGMQGLSRATLTECASPILEAAPVADPYADLVAPATNGACRSSSGASLLPGRYCGGLRLSGNVTLQPGVYVISGGDFRVNANARISGTGVTIFLDSGVQVNMNGNAAVQLTAPTTGPYAGVLFFGDRSTTGTSSFNGTADSLMTGAVYMPTRSVSYLGNFSGLNGCTQIVADTVSWSGNTSVSVDCTAAGIRTLPVLQVVQLVE